MRLGESWFCYPHFNGWKKKYNILKYNTLSRAAIAEQNLHFSFPVAFAYAPGFPSIISVFLMVQVRRNCVHSRQEEGWVGRFAEPLLCHVRGHRFS